MQPGSGVSAAGGRDSQAPGHAAVLSEELLPGLLHPTGVLPMACWGRQAGVCRTRLCEHMCNSAATKLVIGAAGCVPREDQRERARTGPPWLLLGHGAPAGSVSGVPVPWPLGSGCRHHAAALQHGAGAPCGWFPCSALKFPAFVSPLAAASVKYSFNRERVLCWR